MGGAMERNVLVDRLKGYACFLVLFGHVIRGIRSAAIPIPSFFEGMELFIWSFHVALFLFLSGVVYTLTGEWKRQKTKGKFILHKLLSLGVPYVVDSRFGRHHLRNCILRARRYYCRKGPFSGFLFLPHQSIPQKTRNYEKTNKAKRLLSVLNYPRTLPVYLCAMCSKQKKEIQMDVARWNEIDGNHFSFFESLNWYMTTKRDKNNARTKTYGRFLFVQRKSHSIITEGRAAFKSDRAFCI